MKPILVSACLLGTNCKYSGGNNLCPKLMRLAEHQPLIPVCPEQLAASRPGVPPPNVRGTPL